MTKNDNVVLVDFIMDSSSDFIRTLNNCDIWGWKSIGVPSNGAINKRNRHKKWIKFTFQIFKQRSEFHHILSWQQFLGIYLSAFCRLLHVKKTFHIHIMTFIYKSRQGWKGKLYHHFINYAISAKYVDSIIIFGGEHELAYYQQCFSSCKDKFIALPLGISKIKDIGTVSESNFILAAGRSNRDYQFLVNAIKGTPYRLIIISDTLLKEYESDNIKILNDVYLPKMFDYLNAAKCVVIPLSDPNISSGQLFFLQSMQLGKPIIITESNALSGYIENGVNGLIIPKTKEALLGALDSVLSDSTLYEHLQANGKRMYEEQFSEVGMAKNIINKVINRL